MKPYIYDRLKEYAKSGIYPFHMPGHKQGRGLDLKDIMKIDVTEIEGLDNFHNPTDIILKAEQETAKLFGAQETFFLINGSSCGNMASILSVCNPDDTIVVARNCHISVYNSLIMTGVNPLYIEPELVSDLGIIGGINPQTLKKCLEDNKNVKAVIITSPTYEGFTSDIKAIADIVHQNNSILIVDEAHGAHFKFNKSFPKTSLEQGADLVIQSVHKTLPSLTQTALLHVQGDLVDRDRLKQMLSMVQSTSPSYILMSSIDLCRLQLSNYNFDYYIDTLIKFRDSLNNTASLKLIGKELEKTYCICEVDISKLVIVCNTNDITGIELDSILRAKYKLQVEASSLNYIIGISTICDDEDGFERFSFAINEIDKTLKYKPISNNYNFYSSPHITITPREAIFGKKVSLELNKCISKIAGEFVIPYPPGIPILAPGEIITDEIIKTIYICRQNNIPIVGMKDAARATLQILK